MDERIFDLYPYIHIIHIHFAHALNAVESENNNAINAFYLIKINEQPFSRVKK